MGRDIEGNDRIGRGKDRDKKGIVGWDLRDRSGTATHGWLQSGYSGPRSMVGTWFGHEKELSFGIRK